MDFKAGVQYDDWVGTAAADDADQRAFQETLRNEGLISADEIIVGIRGYVAENFPGQVQPAYVEFLVVPLNEAQARLSAPTLRARSVQKTMSVDDFIGRFKRFAVSFSSRHYNIVEYQTEE